MRSHPSAKDVGMTIDCIIAESTEFVCERWGQGEATVDRYAPLTRDAAGRVWIHPGWARDCSWEEMTARATSIWGISGSFWNVGGFVLIYRRGDPRIKRWVFATPR